MILDEKKALLQVEDLSVEFRTAEGVVHAVNHLSYSLREGEALGIVGESGSGKSVSSLASMRLIPNPPGKIVNGRILYGAEIWWPVLRKKWRRSGEMIFP